MFKAERVSKHVWRIHRKKRPAKLRLEPLYPFDLSDRHWYPNKIHSTDVQREKVYQAEIHWMHKCHGKYRCFLDIDDVAAYLLNVLNQPWFADNWPAFEKLKVEYLPKSRACWGGARKLLTGTTQVREGFVRFSRWGMGLIPDTFYPNRYSGGELVVLHELAHALCRSGIRHNRRWAYTYLTLVRLHMGSFHFHGLRDQFLLHGVHVNPVNEKAAIAAWRPPR